MTSSANRSLTLDTLNPQIKIMEYAVRGPIVVRAVEITKEIQKNVKKPFSEVINANIGDCHAMGQIPISFIRQVVSLVSYPKLLDNSDFPEDAKARARMLLAACKGKSIGSYSDSAGIELIRKHVAEYIQKRDGIAADFQNIFLGNGASDCITGILKLMVCNINNKKAGIMVPIPQYPLYSAKIVEFNMEQISYYLDEPKCWTLNIEELQKAINKSKEHCHPQAIVVINPGNPTGQVLSRENIEQIIKFAHKEKLFILADEVYQHNIYKDGAEFVSFKKVLSELESPYNTVELASFMSCSKGFLGECGLRGGYVELVNMDPEVRKHYTKSITASLGSNVIGQVVMDIVVNPPKSGEPSYDLFMQEKKSVLDSLKRRAKMVEETFNSFENFHCNPVQGAMYAFPQIKLPAKAIEAAKAANQEADVFYAFELLENTGICVIPGSGFGQLPGTYHFRTTILPQPEKLEQMLKKFKEFHEFFVKKYS